MAGIVCRNVCLYWGCRRVTIKACDPETGLCVTNAIADTEEESAVIMCVYTDEGLLNHDMSQCYCELSHIHVIGSVTVIVFYFYSENYQGILDSDWSVCCNVFVFFPGNILLL